MARYRFQPRRAPLVRSGVPTDWFEEDLGARAALTSRWQSFGAEVLTQEENLASLAAIDRKLVAKVETINLPHWVVLDMGSTGIPVYGQR